MFRDKLIAPLQFLAILNMLAALQYISHASSTLWWPLDKNREIDAHNWVESKCSKKVAWQLKWGEKSDLINDACMAPVGDELCDLSSWCSSEEDALLKLVDWLS